MTQIKNFKIEVPSLPTENLYQKLGGSKKISSKGNLRKLVFSNLIYI